MDFALNDEQKMMIDTVRRFIAEELRPLEDELENQDFLAKDKALAIHQKAKELGLYALNMPGELGGGDLSNLDRILCEEQFGHTSDYLIRPAAGLPASPPVAGAEWCGRRCPAAARAGWSPAGAASCSAPRDAGAPANGHASADVR